MTETVQIALIAGGVAVIGGIVTQIPAIIIALTTRREMVALKVHVNSNTEKLVEASKLLASKEGHDVGHAEGVAQEVARAEGLASTKL